MKIDENKTVKGYKVLKLEPQAIKEFPEICRRVAADGAVLLKNDNNVLPFTLNDTVSVFGRTQYDYNKSGTGSGGLVNVDYVTNIIDSLKNSNAVKVNEKLAEVYKNWIKENPFDKGIGWANEPWCQKEMPVSDELCKECADATDKALIVIGRTAGEDKDNHYEEGSYLLNEEEKALLKVVTSHFDKVCLILNVGNIIDMSFLEEYKIDSVMYVWHGGMEGGNAVADVLTGKVNPSGKLADTIALNIEDYPSNDNFGSKEENKYIEDIYVGYRYFETFCPEKVRYPFGFGLSYTDFEIKVVDSSLQDTRCSVTVEVKNTGKVAGKESIQVYYSAPQGKLGRPSIELATFKKTGLINPGETELVKVDFDFKTACAFDDSGVTGNKNCFVLEKGKYEIKVGNCVRNTILAADFELAEDTVLEKCNEAMAPVKHFERIKPVVKDGKFTVTYENVPEREIDLDKRIIDNRPADIKYSGDKGYKLLDVVDEKCTIDQFVAQMTNEDLFAIVKGEGMNSPKVTAGTGGAFGGVTERLLDFGIPVACVTDGPSGVRLDSGAKATAMPIGTLLACTFDDSLIEELHIYEGLELVANGVDALLGPGMNIHRHPLNGRNFEYFSEDPVLTGKMGAAICRGIEKSGPTATIKHMVANNQEIGRSEADSVVSQRALREIYLKGFEIAVKEGKARAIMTSYNPTNGFWNAGNYDLNTTILRDEWNFEGFVMTDWWAKMNCEGGEATNLNIKQMVRAQNDIFMVCKSAEQNPDNLPEGFEEGYITRGELQRCCKNLIKYIIKTPSFEKYVLGGCVKPDYAVISDEGMKEIIHFDNIVSDKKYDIDLPEDGKYMLVYKLHSDASALAQVWTWINIDGEGVDSISLCGTNGKSVEYKQPLDLKKGKHQISLTFEPIMNFDSIIIKK